MANISKLVKKLTGKELGNLIIKDIVLQMTDPQNQTEFGKDELDGAVDALTGDRNIRDYNNRIQIKNFLIELVGRRDYAQLLASKNCALITMTALLEKQYLQELGKPEPLRFTYAEYQKATEQKLDEYYRDENGKPRTITMLELLYREINLDDVDEKDYMQPLSATEIQYYRDGAVPEMADDGTTKTVNDKQIDRIQNLAKRTNDDKLEADKDVLQIVIDYIKQPDLFENEPTTHTRKFNAYDTLYELPHYVAYLRWKGLDDEIEPVMKRYEPIIKEAIDKMENKPLAQNMKRLSLYELATKDYPRKQIEHDYRVDFTSEAWGNDDDHHTHILITPYGKLDDVRGDMRFFPKTGNAIEQIDLNKTITALEESIGFCKGYDLMIDILAEHLGIPELLKVKSDMNDLELQKSLTYRSVLDLAKYCAVIGEYGEYLNKQTTDEIKQIINNINKSVCDIKYIVDKNKESEAERRQKMKDMLDKSAIYGERFTDIQNKFLKVAMGSFAE